MSRQQAIARFRRAKFGLPLDVPDWALRQIEAVAVQRAVGEPLSGPLAFVYPVLGGRRAVLIPTPPARPA